MLINSLQIVDSFVKKEVDTPTFTLKLIQGNEPFVIPETAIIRLILESNGNNVVNKLIEVEDNDNGIVPIEGAISYANSMISRLKALEDSNVSHSKTIADLCAVADFLTLQVGALTSS